MVKIIQGFLKIKEVIIVAIKPFKNIAYVEQIYYDDFPQL